MIIMIGCYVVVSVMRVTCFHRAVYVRTYVYVYYCYYYNH